jgi:hypothetical protein
MALVSTISPRSCWLFLQTLVAFCPFYVANDHNAAGPMDNYNAETLRDYAAVTYEALHNYLITGLRYWYVAEPRDIRFAGEGLGRC